MEYKKHILNSQLRNPNRPTAKNGGSVPLINKELVYTLSTGTPHYVLDAIYQNRPVRVYEKESPTLRGNCGSLNVISLNVSDSPKSINTPNQSTNTTSQTTLTSATQPKSTQTNSPTSTSWLQDFLAKHSALQVKEGDSVTHEEHSFLKSYGFSKRKNRKHYYSKNQKPP